MSQIVTTPDGVEHEFPDETSDDVIKKALQSYKSSGAGSPPTDAPVGGSPSVASAPTAPTDQPSRPVTPTPDAFSQARSNDMDWLRIASDAATGGYWNKALDAMSGNDLHQAMADAAKSRQGLMGTIPATAGMMLNPLTKVMGPAEGILGATGQGAVQGGVSALGHGEDPTTGMLEGGATGFGAGILGKVANSTLNAAKNWWNGPAAKPEDIQQGIDSAWQSVNSARYSPKDVQAVSRGAQIAAQTHPEVPMTGITNPKSKALLDDFSDYSTDPTSTNSVRELRGWQDKADALKGDDAVHGKILSDRIDDLLQGGKPTSVPKGMLAADVQNTATTANSGQELLEQYNRNLAKDPQTALGKAGDLMGGHAWGQAHHLALPIAEAGLAGYGGFEAGGWIPAVAAAGATLAGQPIIQAGSRMVGDAGRRAAGDAAMRAAMGTPSIDISNPLHKLLMGGYLSQ